MYIQARKFIEVGKLENTLAEAEPSVETNSHRLFVVDKNSQHRFLIDTGANISVLPRPIGAKPKSLDFQLYAANNTTIPTYGEKTITLDLNLRRPFKWTFIVAEVDKPIIGADFLKHHQLIVDLPHRRLIDAKTSLTSISAVQVSNTPTVKTIDDNQKYHAILAEFPAITRLSPTPNAIEYVQPNVEHYIETTGPPVYCRARPIAPHRYDSVKKEFEHMLEQGICRPSKSPWASPLHIVPKTDGSIRVCGDYRRLNACTKPDRYPIPRIKDFTFQLTDKTIYSVIDLNRAYAQLRTREEDIEKTAIITPIGLYEFPRMIPGLKNAGQTFQRFIHEVLRGFDYVFPFVDDLLIASPNETTHEQHLRNVLKRLEENGITINPAKCVLGQPQVKFLGYTVSKNGIIPPAEKVIAITNYSKPRTIEELRRFLGMINFYRDHIPDAAKIQAPLNAYLHCVKKRDKTEIQWTDEAILAFEACKNAIKNAALLAHPSHSAPIAIFTDASDKSAGAVLQQYVDEKWQPLGYFSKKFSDAQKLYSTFDRELLSIYMAIKHFRKMFEGRNLIIFTDHKPLTYVLQKPPSLSETPRRARQLIFISEFTTDIRHISGKDNIVADALSRVESVTCPTTLDYHKIATAQERDSTTIQYLEKQSNLALKPITLPGTSIPIYCETSTSFIRPYLPEEFRRDAFDAVHNISHPGIRTTRKLVTEKFFWPSMNTDVATWARQCIRCQQCKVIRHTWSETSNFPPTDRFQHIHVDIVGPLPTSPQGNRYLVTMIDRVTRWPEAIPTDDITAEAVAKIVYENWITRFGCPIYLTSDQGRQFESQLFAKLLAAMGTKRNRTTPYHPQSNGIVERWHRTLKTALKTRLNNSTWIDELPTVLMGLRAATRSDTGISAAELTYGHNIRLPSDFFAPPKLLSNVVMDYDFVDNLRATIAAMTPDHRNTSHSNRRPIFVHEDLKTCDYVFIRTDAVKKPLQPAYEGPYKVIERNDKTFLLKLPPNRSPTISIDRLKPAYTVNIDHDTDADAPATSRDSAATTSSPSHHSTTHIPTGIVPATKQTRSGRKIKLPVRFA